MPILKDITFFSYNSIFSPSLDYLPIYRSLPASTKQCLLSFLDTSHPTTCLTYIRSTVSHVIKTKFHSLNIAHTYTQHNLTLPMAPRL